MRQVLFVLITLAGLLAVAPVLAQPAEPDLSSCARWPSCCATRRSRPGCRRRPKAGRPALPPAPAAAEAPTLPSDGRPPDRRHARVPAPARGGGPDAARRAPPGLDAARMPRRQERGLLSVAVLLAVFAAPRLRPRVAVLVGRRPEFARASSRAASRPRANACARSGGGLSTVLASCSPSPSAASAPSCCSSGRRCSRRSCSPISWSF